MDLKGFLKFIFDSKKLLTALLVVGLVLYFGPRHYPSYIPKVPDPWGFAPVALMSLTGVPLVLWGLAVVGDWLMGVKGWALRWGLSFVDLTPAEMKLLRMMAVLPDYLVGLGRVTPEWRIEIDACLHELARRGLVERFGPSDEFARLTPRGKREAMKLREARRQSGEAVEEEELPLFR
ncbi:hypothetical protein [Cupriavidus sp. DL-D2]|uniref:hypothetical protein n=1 Tax=Cupriavidus sp. DL-D2 TaxID=3144974 RepID=UPI00321328DC